MNTLCDEKKIIYSFAKRNQGQQSHYRSLLCACTHVCMSVCAKEKGRER